MYSIFNDLDLGRLKRSKSAKYESYKNKNGACSALFIGSAPKPYKTTLESCTCKDYAMGYMPCKHMIRLAIVAGVIDEDALLEYLSAEAALEKAKYEIAKHFGLYHAFGEREIEDEEYDALRAVYKEMNDRFLKMEKPMPLV